MGARLLHRWLLIGGYTRRWAGTEPVDAHEWVECGGPFRLPMERLARREPRGAEYYRVVRRRDWEASDG